ncbi:MAG: DUF2258 domain-containing protein [Desulfurococcales archaeon]|nr:DUF2258 domain-containing protein [Desulfurococcales archaeon]
MPQTLSTGLVIAGAYADKIRKVLFAQLREALKKGEIENREVARAAAELNRVLFHILVDRLGTDKGDVVRVRIDYELDKGAIKWIWDTLRLEVFKRVPEEVISKALGESLEHVEELSEAPQYTVERIGVTPLDDVVYEVRLGDKRVGAFLVESVDGEAIVKGVIVEPQPLLVKRAIIDVEEDLDEAVRSSLNDILGEAEQTTRETAEKVLDELLEELRE